MRKLILALFLLLPGLVQAQVYFPPPICIQADLNHPETATLTWQDNSTDESGFIVERKQDAGAFQVIAGALAPDAKTYIDTSVKRAAVPVTYTYRVKAFRQADNTSSPFSNESCITFAPVIPPPPILQAPAGLTLSGITQTEIQASWEDTPGETGYRLVLTGGTPATTLINYPAQNATTYTRAGLTKNKTFCGVLYATASGVESPPSVKSCATTKR